MGGFELGRWNVAAVPVEPVVVEPGDSSGGRQFDVLDGLPWFASVDQFSLVQTDDGLGQRVVIGTADSPDRGLDSGFSESFGEADGGVLRSPIRMVHNAFEIEDALLLAGPDGLLDGVEDHGGGHRGGYPPAQDPAGVGVGDEGDVGEAGPG